MPRQNDRFSDLSAAQSASRTWSAVRPLQCVRSSDVSAAQSASRSGSVSRPVHPNSISVFSATQSPSRSGSAVRPGHSFSVFSWRNVRSTTAAKTAANAAVSGAARPVRRTTSTFCRAALRAPRLTGMTVAQASRVLSKAAARPRVIDAESVLAPPIRAGEPIAGRLRRG
ncbi:hypothetical protein M885DRAFT_549299 [Pelagophyceae sp. CCMP2097]|nr:hypothetical protein M885DRAFT_549299 [Pelagophyceae sp. CCMP2097]